MRQVWRISAHSSSLWVVDVWRCVLCNALEACSLEAGRSCAKQGLGTNMQDDARLLKDCGITPSTRILVLGGHSAAQRADLAAQDASAKARDERQERLNRLRHAAEALARRSGARWACAQRRQLPHVPKPMMAFHGTSLDDEKLPCRSVTGHEWVSFVLQWGAVQRRGG